MKRTQPQTSCTHSTHSSALDHSPKHTHLLTHVKIEHSTTYIAGDAWTHMWHPHTHAHKQPLPHAHLHTHTSPPSYTMMLTHTHTHTHAQTRVHTHTRTHTHIHTHTHTHRCTHTHTDTHTRAWAHTHVHEQSAKYLNYGPLEESVECSYADRRDVMKLQIGRVKVSYTDLSAGTRFLEAPICGTVPVHTPQYTLESHSSKNESGTLEFWFGIPMNTITKKPKTKFGPRVVFCFFVSLAAFRKRNGGKIHGPICKNPLLLSKTGVAILSAISWTSRDLATTFRGKSPTAMDDQVLLSQEDIERAKEAIVTLERLMTSTASNKGATSSTVPPPRHATTTGPCSTSSTVPGRVTVAQGGRSAGSSSSTRNASG